MVSPMSRNSKDPAKITPEKTLAHHQARPECTTSIPKAMPMGKMASPTEPETFSAAGASDRGGGVATARVDDMKQFYSELHIIWFLNRTVRSYYEQ
jgi:hypothetical protein